MHRRAPVSPCSSRRKALQWILNRKFLSLLLAGFVWFNVKLLGKFHAISDNQDSNLPRKKAPAAVLNDSIFKSTRDIVLPSNKSKHALLVPYRNRSHHLASFLDYMDPWLKQHFPSDHFALWIIEQDDDQLFNRAWLGNVGLTEIMQRQPDTHCVIFHDVDLVPNQTSHVPYTSCESLPMQLASQFVHFNGTTPYETYCGGVVSMSLTHWKQINGMSNDFVGKLLLLLLHCLRSIL
jgi:hypothetical protein